jgi:ABC-type sugar transport system permease subunit
MRAGLVGPVGDAPGLRRRPHHTKKWDMSITDVAGSDALRAAPRDRRSVWERLNAALPLEILCILPALIATILVIVVPLLYSLGISFYRYILTDPQNFRFVGFANYVQAFSDSSFLSALRTTFVYTVGTVAAQFVLGMVFALFLQRHIVKGLTPGAVKGWEIL